MANPRGQQRDKPFREALQMEIAAAGDNHKRLRQIARKLIASACDGDMQAIQQVADRLDGKPAQAVDLKHDASDAFAQLWGMISSGATLPETSYEGYPINHTQKQ
jgi:hypothetical protein